VRTLDVPEQVAFIATMVADDAVENALELLVQRHARFVYQVAYSVLRNHHDAEDAAQETFLRVMSHRRELAGVKDERAWLARIAWRIAVDRRRHVRPEVVAQRSSAGSDDDTDVLNRLRATDAGAEQTVITAQMLAIAERLIARLPSDLRDVLTLSTVSEMTSVEIATVLQIPEASVRTRLFRARQLLKEKLSALLEGKAV
jgi:RNA polymerase sigma-70 factor, ECF subfamily